LYGEGDFSSAIGKMEVDIGEYRMRRENVVDINDERLKGRNFVCIECSG
jgi:hypothetical protein